MYTWGELILLSLKPFGRFPVTLQTLWITASFCFFLFILIFFFLLLLRNVRNKYFYSKWHGSASQRHGPGPFPPQPPLLFLTARHAAGAQSSEPFGQCGHTGEVPKPSAKLSSAEQGRHQLSDKLPYKFQTRGEPARCLQRACWRIRPKKSF